MNNDTNTSAPMIDARARILARLAADTAAYSNPIMPDTISRPAPRNRKSPRRKIIR